MRILFAKGSGILASFDIPLQSHSSILYGDEIHAASQSNHMPKQNSSQATPTTTLAREQVPHVMLSCQVQKKSSLWNVAISWAIGMIWKPFCCTIDFKIPQPAQASINRGVSLAT